MNTLRVSPSPAELLEGKTLDNGWHVDQRIDRPDSATGGHFSTSYCVSGKRGRRGFLKAMDYRKALKADDPARELQAMTAAFNFERDILEKCRDRQLSRVVTVLDSGQVRPTNGQLSDLVEYLIFELAAGDLRSFVKADTMLQSAWTLRTLHQAAAALMQLHSSGIAHQDVKPSNVLVFDELQSTDTNSKLADLGRASEARTRLSLRRFHLRRRSNLCAARNSLSPPLGRLGPTQARLRPILARQHRCVLLHGRLYDAFPILPNR